MIWDDLDTQCRDKEKDKRKKKSKRKKNGGFADEKKYNGFKLDILQYELKANENQSI